VRLRNNMSWRPDLRKKSVKFLRSA